MPTAADVIAEVRGLLAGEPAFLAGSLVAEDEYGLSNAHDDVDIFVPTQEILVALTQKLLGEGFTMDDRMARTWYRWKHYGFKKWHTNSMKLTSPGGIEFNLVYKLTDGHAVTSLSQVLESFDFGLLGVGYDLERNVRGDLRGYLFPDQAAAAQANSTGRVPDWDGVPLPLMPAKRANWRQGFISQYNGLREAGRYVKYVRYGYDLSLVKDDLVTGYWEAEHFYSNSFKPEFQKLGKIYELIALKIEGDDFDDLDAASKEINYNDDLDVIMEALE